MLLRAENDPSSRRRQSSVTLTSQMLGERDQVEGVQKEQEESNVKIKTMESKLELFFNFCFRMGSSMTCSCADRNNRIERENVILGRGVTPV